MIFRHLRKHGRISKRLLERSLSTNVLEVRAPIRGRHQVIVTLDPNKFAEKEQKRLDIGNMQFFTPSVTLHNQSIPVKARQRIDYDYIPHKAHEVENPSFPPDTKAFLYYFTSPEKPRISGELRLRVASSDEPESFKSGSDLLGLDGRPWSRPVYVVSKYYSSLYEKLRDEGLVPDDLDAVLSTFPPNPKYRGHNRLLYTLNDTFVVDFSKFMRRLSVVTEQGMEMIQCFGLFSEARPKLYTPYTGSALARFERSTLPSHEGTRTVVLRFLKIITPVSRVKPDYDGYICLPKEGKLHRLARGVKLSMFDLNKPVPVPVWSLNIDKPNELMSKANGLLSKGLRLLWDATDNL